MIKHSLFRAGTWGIVHVHMHRRTEYFAVGLHDELAQPCLLRFAGLCESLWIHDAGFFLYRHTKNFQWNTYHKPYLPILGREKWDKIAARLPGSYFCMPGETEGKIRTRATATKCHSRRQTWKFQLGLISTIKSASSKIKLKLIRKMSDYMHKFNQ